MKIENTNDSFGDAGPFEAESIDTLVDEMIPTLRRWAEEKFVRSDDASIDGGITREQWLDQETERLAREFRSGLEVVEE